VTSAVQIRRSTCCNALTPQPSLCRWLEDIRDWCVSRQLWWGHRIPAFYAVLDGEASTPGSLDERLDQWLVAADREAAEQLAQEKFPGRSFTLHQARFCGGSSPTALHLKAAAPDKRKPDVHWVAPCDTEWLSQAFTSTSYDRSIPHQTCRRICNHGINTRK